MNAADK